ncbi:MAG: leucine-rich repeat domain-containing protein [Porphyromonadaceae bacterium]|nr:MAG: leucine-rich repeat domain-containing protein [Porphyromonadaceae bacterium]
MNSSNTEYAPTASSYTVDGYTYDLAEVTYNACESNTNLKTVDLSRLSYLRAINDYAFKGCSALTTIKLNSSTSLSIYSEAFANCTSLTTLNLTSNVYDIYGSAVNGCSNLKTITVSTLNKHLCDVNGIVYSKDKTELVRCPPGHNTTIFNHSSFPSTLEKIGNRAFATCKKIQMIHIPYGVKTIEMCFQECTGLTTLQIPSSVTTFGYAMWGDIPNLTYFYYNFSTPPSGMPYGPYSSAPRLTLYVPDEAIEAYKKATYWSTWKYIKGGAFDVTTNDAMQTLRYTIHSNKAETINGNSYAGRAMLVYAPDPTVYSQTYAVPDHVTLANGKKYAVTAINSNVCSGGMRASATLTLGANVDSIFSNAFKGKTMLTGLKLNSKLTYIGVNAFYDCRIANDLALPYGFKILSSGAFYNNSFKRFLIPGSLISLANTCLARNNYLEELVINDPFWANYTTWDLTKIPTSCKLYVPVGSEEAYKKNEKWGKLNVMGRLIRLHLQ